MESENKDVDSLGQKLLEKMNTLIEDDDDNETLPTDIEEFFRWLTSAR